eukprot:gene10545-18645_t
MNVKRDRGTDGPGSAGKRPRVAGSTEKAEKTGKGLRHFSMKVCKKVKEKGVTSYNEVADELVLEQQMLDEQAVANGEEDSSEPHGPKNIRRRVYDALNVLMAMNIISKEKKEIKWIGLPSNSQQEYNHLIELKQKKTERIRMKTAYLQDLILQQIAFKNLLKRNEQSQAAEAFAAGGAGAADGAPALPSSAIHLPFIVVNTSKSANINCQMAGDKAEYYFDFSQPFEIHDDMEVLKRMGLAYHLESGNCDPADLEDAKALIPAALEPYLNDMVAGGRA